MFRWTVLTGVLLCCAATLAAAQATARAIDPVFVRAQTLVSDGNGAAGRALIDSVIAATPPSARLYPEALFWRASLAANAADAESDYRHIVVDYPLAPQAEDALLALAQANPAEMELRNQIQYQGQRCPLPAVAKADSPTTNAYANSAAISASSSTPTNITTSVQTSIVPTAPTKTSVGSASTTSATSGSVAQVGIERTEASDSVSPVVKTASTTPKQIVQTQRPKPPTEANDSKPSIVDPTKAPKTTTPRSVAAKPATKTGVPAPHGSGYSVQVAAFTGKDGKVEADKLASRLSKRGYSARVDGSVAPFRVRIGRYSTEKEAEDALRKIKAKHMDGLVVRAPER